MDRDVRIYTPENVSIRYEAANLGSRLIAIFIDNLIQISVYAILITTLVLTSLDSTEHVEKSEGINIVGLSILIICIFLVNTFYHIFFELVMKGQTPGKKVAKIRVTSVTGEPINFIKSFIRNLVRLVDILREHILSVL